MCIDVYIIWMYTYTHCFLFNQVAEEPLHLNNIYGLHNGLCRRGAVIASSFAAFIGIAHF